MGLDPPAWHIGSVVAPVTQKHGLALAPKDHGCGSPEAESAEETATLGLALEQSREKELRSPVLNRQNACIARQIRPPEELFRR
jgi:hypothetical protein